MLQIQSGTAGDVIAITYNKTVNGELVPFNFTGWTPVCYVGNPGSATPYAAQTAVTNELEGELSLTTVSGMFPTAGTYNVQIISTNGSNTDKSPLGQVTVIASLA
ncbi:MAG: hypothetical protein ABSD03_16275 [Vulcanimicrobiaceae bacterium]|jgi:hypothetical protein